MRRLILVVILCFFSLAALAHAETEGTGWQAFSQVAPTNLKPGGTGQIQLYIMNTGAKPSSGSITVTDTLPAGLTATKAGGMSNANLHKDPQSPNKKKKLNPRRLRGSLGLHGRARRCRKQRHYVYEQPGVPAFIARFNEHEDLVASRLGIAVSVAPGASERQPTSSGCQVEPASSACNRVTVAGGGAAGATNVSDPVAICSSEPGFGIPGWDVWFSSAAGAPTRRPGRTRMRSRSPTLRRTREESERQQARGRGSDGTSKRRCRPVSSATPAPPRAVPARSSTRRNAPSTARSASTASDSGTLKAATVPSVDFPCTTSCRRRGSRDEFAFAIFGKDVIFDSSPSSAGGYRIVTHIDNIPQAGVDATSSRSGVSPPKPATTPQRCIIAPTDSGGTQEATVACRRQRRPSRS